MDKGEIILYQPDNSIRLEVRMEEETVWLTQAQIGLLFGVQKAAISKHLKNIFQSGELQQTSVVSILETTANDGKKYATKFYNLDAVLSVGYRVNSVQATQFRIWANHILKEYILRGAAVNQRFEQVEERLRQNELGLLSVHQKMDYLVQTALPPRQGVFCNGQIFDAYTFASDLIRTARKRIILIDNYVDDSVLKMLTKRGEGVCATFRYFLYFCTLEFLNYGYCSKRHSPHRFPSPRQLLRCPEELHQDAEREQVLLLHRRLPFVDHAPQSC